MSQGQDKASDISRSFWQSVIGTEQKAGNAAHIQEKLTELAGIWAKYQQKVEETVVNQTLTKLHIDSAAIKSELQSHSSHAYLSNCTIDAGRLYKSLEDFDSTMPETIDTFKQQIHHIIEQFISPTNIPDKDELKEAIVQYADNCITFYLSLSSDDNSAIEENITILIEDTIDIIGFIAGLNDQQLAYAHSFVGRANTILSIAKRNKPSPSKPRYEPSIKAQYDALKPALPEIETEIKKGSFPNGKKIKEVHLPELFEAGIAFTDINQYDYQKTVLEQAKDKIANLLDVLKTNYDNPEIQNVIDILKTHILHWLTLPNDFRPENWVELIHFIVKNIQFSLNEYNNNRLITHWFMPFINKLERFIATVDNDDFKLIVATKEEPYILEIDLPDILEPEDQDPLSKSKGDKPIYRSAMPTEARGFATANEADAAEAQPLTLSTILEFLCFDENFGALAKLDPDHTEVIYDIYYQSWLSNRVDTIVEDALQLFSIETLVDIWESIEAKTFDEKGVNLSELIDFIIDESIDWVNGILDFIKKTVEYIINEVFLLGKAIIGFFQNVDLPPVVKKLPPFKDMLHGNVTLLHVVAAIPYTLYQEFIHFEYNPEVQPISAV
jgi:hypothetical protein